MSLFTACVAGVSIAQTKTGINVLMCRAQTEARHQERNNRSRERTDIGFKGLAAAAHHQHAPAHSVKVEQRGEHGEHDGNRDACSQRWGSVQPVHGELDGCGSALGARPPRSALPGRAAPLRETPALSLRKTCGQPSIGEFYDHRARGRVEASMQVGEEKQGSTTEGAE